jgi:hypothetical protein
MNVAPAAAYYELGNALSDLPQAEKVYYMRHLILDLMDYTEQSEDETIWCELLRDLEKHYPQWTELEALWNGNGVKIE